MEIPPGLSGMHLDARALRVLAHPLRSRLLSALRVGGPATATGLATALGTNTGATSYHLRKLESVGLVTDTGEGEGRRRLWRASTESHHWEPSDFAGDEDAETALGWLVRNYLHQFVERFDRWLDAAEAWPMPWRDAAGMSDAAVLVGPEQLASMGRELQEVVARYRRAGENDPRARRVSVHVAAYPLDPADVPTPETS
ncbi:ArsR/SmtB family transcription factor [Auraticoccus monumenti]|uniref:DNA-binding transcriptional regulator, ArsR family n=1 Tax=Auraticoccus monumenti TaxID=675864 RepID=A0A1G6Y7J6_9ACTN|nr:helix-turn-helix domain-containing protein [Auraticoccus monumenti]SDD86464.1 DNA-binding transcriptional regulator, ArsR family [Auraticoccus monumenti]